jgi:hypothetical protein
MEAARTTEVVIGATSSRSFEDAIVAGVSRATATLRAGGASAACFPFSALPRPAPVFAAGWGGCH